MTLHVLGNIAKSTCTRACAQCSNARAPQPECDGRTACRGYGSSTKCPPLIVLAVLEAAAEHFAAAALPGLAGLGTVQA